jgi:hypothetical protein
MPRIHHAKLVRQGNRALAQHETQFLYVQLALPQDAHCLAFGFSASPQFRQRGAGFLIRDQW